MAGPEADRASGWVTRGPLCPEGGLAPSVEGMFWLPGQTPGPGAEAPASAEAIGAIGRVGTARRRPGDTQQARRHRDAEVCRWLAF